MTREMIVPLLLAAVVMTYLGIAIRAAWRLRGKRVVTCPETKQPAGVTVDVGHAATTAVWEKADVRIKECSRWPERSGCDQPCAEQIEREPDETRTKVIATHFFKGKHCAICRKPVEPPNAATIPPGFMNPDDHAVCAWYEVAPAELPDAVRRYYPLCANCMVAESFRQRFPDRVTDRPIRPGTSLPPQ